VTKPRDCLAFIAADSTRGSRRSSPCVSAAPHSAAHYAVTAEGGDSPLEAGTRSGGPRHGVANTAALERVFRYFDAFAKVAARAVTQGEHRYAPQRHSPGANPEPPKPRLSIDNASRPSTVAVTANASLGTTVDARRTVYGPATNLPIRTEQLDSGGTVTAQIVRTFDTLGRMQSYTDDAENLSTTGYDIASRANAHQRWQVHSGCQLQRQHRRKRPAQAAQTCDLTRHPASCPDPRMGMGSRAVKPECTHPPRPRRGWAHSGREGSQPSVVTVRRSDARTHRTVGPFDPR
jgi:hypothetical protein